MATVSTPNITFEYSGIGSIFKLGRLKVPPNQREYSWEEKQITDLFQDLDNAIKTKKSTYFLGTIVLAKGGKDIPEIIDGQQRLATTSILLAAIRNHFLKEAEMKNSIDSDFLITYDRIKKEQVPKLTLNIDDNEYFRKRIISSQEVKPTRESHCRIDFAAQKAAEKVQDITKGVTERNANELLNEWLEFIEKRATVIFLSVPDELNAFMMFETLNDRGLKTTQADLLKNYLLREAEDRLNEAQLKWSKMVSNLEALGIDDIIMTYLRHITITQYGPTREKDIFSRIQSNVSGKTRAIIFLDKLAEYADSYAAILTPSHKKWNAYSMKTREAITVLQELRIQQIRPLMLAVAQHFNEIETEKALRSFIFWTVRFLICGGMRGGQLEEAYGLRAKEIVDGKINNTKGLLEALKNILPTDGVFESSFSTARVSQSYLARYYLRSIESYLRQENDEPELTVVKDTGIVNLEHILPQELTKDWSYIREEVASAYTNRLGNLTIMKSKVNTDFGNKSFKIKREEFKKSQLLLNRFIFDMTTEKTKWGIEEIENRQKKLAETAIKTWPLFIS